MHDRVKAKRFEGIRVQFVAFEKKKNLLLRCATWRKEELTTESQVSVNLVKPKFARARDRENADFLRPTDRACTYRGIHR